MWLGLFVLFALLITLSPFAAGYWVGTTIPPIPASLLSHWWDILLGALAGVIAIPIVGVLGVLLISALERVSPPSGDVLDVIAFGIVPGLRYVLMPLLGGAGVTGALGGLLGRRHAMQVSHTRRAHPESQPDYA